MSPFHQQPEQLYCVFSHHQRCSVVPSAGELAAPGLSHRVEADSAQVPSGGRLEGDAHHRGLRAGGGGSTVAPLLHTHKDIASAGIASRDLRWGRRIGEPTSVATTLLWAMDIRQVSRSSISSSSSSSAKGGFGGGASSSSDGGGGGGGGVAANAAEKNGWKSWRTERDGAMRWGEVEEVEEQQEVADAPLRGGTGGGGIGRRQQEVRRASGTPLGGQTRDRKR